MEHLVVGLGDRRYEVVRPWGDLPDGWVLSWVSHVAVDSRDRVYVFQRADPPILIFDRDGAFVGSLGEGRLFDGHGMFITQDDRVFAIDRDKHQLHVFDRSGSVEMSLGDATRPRLQAPFNHPADVAVTPAGDFYVADGYGNSSVHHFSKEGEHLRSWGRPGAGPGEFTTPHGVWYDAKGRVLVADRENDRVQIFSDTGEYLDEWRDLYHPMDIYVDAGGVVMVTDQIPRLTAYSPDGHLIGRCRPALFGAHGLWGDSVGDIYLAEAAPMDRITKLVRVS